MKKTMNLWKLNLCAEIHSVDFSTSEVLLQVPDITPFIKEHLKK